MIKASGLSREEFRKRMEQGGMPTEIEMRFVEEGDAVVALQRTRTTGAIVATIRALLEYLVPVVVGGYAAYILIF